MSSSDHDEFLLALKASIQKKEAFDENANDFLTIKSFFANSSFKFKVSFEEAFSRKEISNFEKNDVEFDKQRREEKKSMRKDSFQFTKQQKIHVNHVFKHDKHDDVYDMIFFKDTNIKSHLKKI